MNVGDDCTERVITVEPGATLKQAASRMREFHVGDLVVVDNERAAGVPIGIITDRDLVMTAIAQDAIDLTVRDVMRDQLITAQDTDSIFRVIELMRTHRVRRVPIVDEEDVLVGMFTSDDAIHILSEQLGALAQLMQSQAYQEQQRRPSLTGSL